MNEVILLSASKTKTNKVILRFAYEDPKNKFIKGLTVLEQWINDERVYDELSKTDFGKKFTAEFDYEDTYNGQARKVIKTLMTEDGELVFTI